MGAAGMFIAILCSLSLTGCPDDIPPGTGTLITSFEIKALDRIVKPEKTATTIEIVLTEAEAKIVEAVKWKLTPTIKYSSGAKIDPTSGVPTDFSAHRVVYTVTGSSGKINEYLVYIGTKEDIIGAKTLIDTFVLYDKNKVKISEALIDNNTNEIIIYVAEDIPRIIKESFFTEIRLEVPNEADMYPESGSLLVDFERAIGTPNPEAIYTVYPRGETKDSPNVRVYTVKVSRDTSGTPDPPDPPVPPDDRTIIDPIPPPE
jgi:hypothetical protein